MKNTKWKYIVKTLVIASVLVSLLVSLNGCKKKPEATEPSSTGETVADTTGSTENTKPDTTEDTIPSQTTDPTADTNATEGTTEAECLHELSNWIVEETSNCTKEGSRYKKCTLCEERIVTEAIPKTEHTQSNWLGKKATCTEEGAQYKECTQCQEKLVSIVVDKADHRPYSVKGQGYTVGYRCSVCHETIQEQYEIPAEGTVPYQIENGTITGLGSWTGSELIIPEKINGQTVTAIGSSAFTNRTSIKTVYIPKTVKEIGEKAFSGCSAITTIVYEGAMKDWVTSVVKGTEWNQNTGNYQIHCNNRILSK